MHRDVSVEALLRWRLTLAAAEAPPPPTAAALLERLQPWWERAPAQFQVRLARVRRMPAAVGFAMSGPERRRGGGMVPALVAGVSADVETYVQLVYVAMVHDRLRLRFTLDVPVLAADAVLDTSFVIDGDENTLLSAVAERSQSGEFRLELSLPPDLVVAWADLKVVDEMPFRLVMQPRPFPPDTSTAGAVRD